MSFFGHYNVNHTQTQKKKQRTNKREFTQKNMTPYFKNNYLIYGPIKSVLWDDFI